MSAAYEYVKSGEISGIRLSTRPDYIDEKILNQLKEYGVTTIELGVQSLNEDVLKLSNRGHSVSDVINAVSLIKQYDFSLGLQMMTGLPGDNDDASIETAEKIIKLSPDFVRIYPTLVIKDTYLEKMFNSKKYSPQPLENAVSLCKTLLLKFQNAGIRVIRIALQTTDEISPGGSLVAGPFDAQFGELVETEIYYDKFTQYFQKVPIKKAVVFVNTKDISKAIGKNKKNILKIKEQFGINIKIKGKDNIEKYDFSVLAESEV